MFKYTIIKKYANVNSFEIVEETNDISYYIHPDYLIFGFYNIVYQGYKIMIVDNSFIGNNSTYDEYVNIIAKLKSIQRMEKINILIGNI